MLEQSETLLRRIDELDNATHTTRANLKQSSAESVERDQAIDMRLQSLEQHLLHDSAGASWVGSPLGKGVRASQGGLGVSGGGGGVGLIGQMQREIEALKEQVLGPKRPAYLLVYWTLWAPSVSACLLVCWTVISAS